MVAVPFRVEAEAGLTPAAVRPAKVAMKTTTAARPTLSRRAPEARVPRDPASVLWIASGVRMVRSFLSLVWFGWLSGPGPTQPLPSTVVEPQLPSVDVKLSKPNSWAMFW